MLGLRYCRQLSLVAESRGQALVAMRRLLTEVASLVAALRLPSTGSVVVAHGLSCSTARGILPDQGSNIVFCTGRGISYH